MIQDPGQRIRAALHTIEQTRSAVAAAWEPERGRFNPLHAAELRRAAAALRRACAALVEVTALVALAGDDDGGQAVLCFACLGAGTATCCHCYGTGAEMSAEQAAELAGRLRAALLAEQATTAGGAR